MAFCVGFWWVLVNHNQLHDFILWLKFPIEREAGEEEKTVSPWIYQDRLDFLKFLASCVNLKRDFLKIPNPWMDNKGLY